MLPPADGPHMRPTPAYPLHTSLDKSGLQQTGRLTSELAHQRAAKGSLSRAALKAFFRVPK